MSEKLKITFYLLILFLAVVGLFFVVGFLALRFGLTTTTGATDFNDRYFADFHQTSVPISEAVEAAELCKLAVIARVQPKVARGLFEIMEQPDYALALNRAIAAQEIYLNQNPGYKQALLFCSDESLLASQANLSDWRDLPEWEALRQAIAKDAETIKLAAQHASVDPRLIVSILVVEQLRLFTSEREIFKQIFQPLKILGTQSKFSLGVMGMKEETARAVEDNLKNKNSDFYLGPEFEHKLDFLPAEADNKDSCRFERLTDQHNHYYSYFYAGLFLKQVMTQWNRLGHSLENRPEILATLFNLGFVKSQPKLNPIVGGAKIEIGNQVYSFGGLAFQFYYSGELANYFPLILN